MKVKATVDGLQDKTQSLTLEVKATLTVQVNMTVEVGEVKVVVKDKDVSVECSAYGDPHMTTFDGK